MNVINDLHPHAHVSQNNALEEDDNTISNDNVEVDESNMPREEHEKFERLLKQAQRELYPRSEGFSVLTTIVEFMHGKVILCKLEQIFPPAFFDVMIHVMIHLVDEAILARPVNFQWMYPIERQLGRFKRYVRNKARPEGSITAGYLSNESLTFCGMYLCNVEISFN